MDRGSYIVTPGNAADLATLDAWLASDEPFLVICGSPSAGKTHLASIAADSLGARFISISDGDGADEALGAMRAAAADAAPLVIDRVERLARPELLLEALQQWRRNGGRLALVGRGEPEAWAGGVVDLATRLGAAPRLVMSEPDEDLIRRVMEKLFADRQVEASPKIIEFAARRLPRRLAAASAFVEAIDLASMRSKSPITLKLAGAAVASIGDDS